MSAASLCCSFTRWGYDWQTVVIHIHHLRVAVAAGLLLIRPGADRVGNASSFKIVKGEPLLGRVDFVGDS